MAEIHNDKVANAVAYLKQNLGTFAIVEPPATGKQQSCVLIENGKFYGMGLLPNDNESFESEHLKSYLTIYPENEMIRTLIKSYAQRNADRIVRMS